MAPHSPDHTYESTAPIPVVLAIDVEPDGKPVRARESIRLSGLKATVSWLDELRPRLEAATGRPANFAWFVRMDPQIEQLAGRPTAVAELASSQLDRLRLKGDGIGLHTHAGRWDGSRRRWVVDHGDPQWVEHCARTSFGAYASTYGHSCRQHRFGDRWSSPDALDLLAQLGARVDLSAEPGRRAVGRVDLSADATGSIPSYLHLHSVPRAHRDPRLWLLPLTSADPGPALELHRRIARRLRFIGQPVHRPMLLDRPWRSAHLYWSVLERATSSQRTPYIALAIRSDLSLQRAIGRVQGILDSLLSRPFARRLQFVDAVAAIDRLSSSVADAPAESGPEI